LKEGIAQLVTYGSGSVDKSGSISINQSSYTTSAPRSVTVMSPFPFVSHCSGVNEISVPAS
jgi:hypothetical protein